MVDAVVPVLALRRWPARLRQRLVSGTARRQAGDQGERKKTRCQNRPGSSHASPSSLCTKIRMGFKARESIGNRDWGRNALQIRQAALCALESIAGGSTMHYTATLPSACRDWCGHYCARPTYSTLTLLRPSP